MKRVLIHRLIMMTCRNSTLEILITSPSHRHRHSPIPIINVVVASLHRHHHERPIIYIILLATTTTTHPPPPTDMYHVLKLQNWKQSAWARMNCIKTKERQKQQRHWWMKGDTTTDASTKNTGRYMYRVCFLSSSGDTWVHTAQQLWLGWLLQKANRKVEILLTSPCQQLHPSSQLFYLSVYIRVPHMHLV